MADIQYLRTHSERHRDAMPSRVTRLVAANDNDSPHRKSIRWLGVILALGAAFSLWSSGWW